MARLLFGYGVDEYAASLIKGFGAKSAFLGYRKYPCHTCISVNEQVVHGLADTRKLQFGDIVSVDCGAKLKGYCGDAATTICVGDQSADVQRLLAATRTMLEIAIAEIKPSRMWSEVARQMQRHAEQNGFSVVREFVGHGIGQEMHEDPKVPNYHDRQQAKHDFELRPGMVLAVEPMVTIGSPDVEYKNDDNWTVVTRDGTWAAHFEHTIAVSERGCEVLTDGQ